jgi:hypothetical protein
MKREQGFTPDSTPLHVQNFFDCIRSHKRSVSDVEIGHQASNIGHLANIVYKTGRKLQWDAKKKTFAEDSEASTMLRRDPRKPWDLVGPQLDAVCKTSNLSRFYVDGVIVAIWR